MSDTPAWLRRMMERDPQAQQPLDDLTKHRMVQYMRESGWQQTAHEARLLSLLWPRWGLAHHALSHRALQMAMPLIEDMNLTGELDAMVLTATCNFAVLRFAEAAPDFDNAPDDLLGRISGMYHPSVPEHERVVLADNRYQYVADALKLSAREDWPELDQIVRRIVRLTYGEPLGDDSDDEILAEKLYDIAERVRRKT